jgi:hypothetical protein
VLSYADAIALIDRVDGVLVVCDPSEVRRDDLARVRELVVGAGGVLHGAVLHSWGAGADGGGRGAGVPSVSPAPDRLPARRETPAPVDRSRPLVDTSETMGLRILDPAELDEPPHTR